MSIRLPLVLGAAVLLTACTGTRVASFGQLTDGDALLTLMVTTDRALVERECAAVPSSWPRYGCMLSRPVKAPGIGDARAVKIVRYTDRLPTALSFEIDAHELCHTVAVLQPIEDPCHNGNGGLLQTMNRR